MLHKSNFSLSSINVAIDFFFGDDLPPYESRDVSKKKVKLSANTICLSFKSVIVSNVLPRSTKVANCSFSVLGLRPFL